MLNEKDYQVACKSDCIFVETDIQKMFFYNKKITYGWDKQQNNKHFNIAYLWPVAMQCILSSFFIFWIF